MRRLLVSLLLLTVFATACGDDGGDDVTTDGGDAPEVTYADIDGKTFVATSAEGHEIVADSTISLTFADETVSAHAGCNSQNAGVELADGKLQVTSEVASTMMGCEDALMAQDQWVAGLLEADPDVTLDGEVLTLTAGDDVLELSVES